MSSAVSHHRQWTESSNAPGGSIRDTPTMFQLLFERSADAIFLFDPREQVFVDCNEAAVQMMRAGSKQQLLKVHPAELSPEFQPDGRSSREKTPEVTRLAMAKGTHRFEWLARRFDGVEFPVEVLLTPIQTGEHPLMATVCRDISERKAAEAALRESEARFRLLFERSADAMSLFDPQIGRFIKSNEAIARQVGAPSVEALGQATPAEISPERQPDGRFSQEKAEEMIQLALSRGSHRFEWMSRRYDGSELPIEIVLTAIPFGDRPLLFAVSRDISDRKRAERKILELNMSLEQRVTQRTWELLKVNEQLTVAEQESRIRATQFQKHRDVLLELAQLNKSDFQHALGKICSAAASTLEVARVSYWSVTDNRAAIVCEHLHSLGTGKADEQTKGTRLAATACPAYFEALAAKRPIVADRVLEHPATKGLGDSYLKPLGISSMLDAPVWVRGDVVGVLCHEHVGPGREWSAEEIDFASDLAATVSLALEESQRARSETELRESERRLRESEARFSVAFQTSPVFITISRFDDGRYVLANEAFLKWTGYRLEEVLRRDSRELSLWAEAKDRDIFWEELRRARSIRERECRVRSRDGTIVTMLLSADIIEINGVEHLLTVGLDITQRKQAEAELLKTVQREKELGQLRSSFVSMVSHEFRTPLGIIQSSAEILDDYLEQLEPAERKEHLQSIQKNTRRMASLMEEVLLIGSFDAGKVEFKPERMDPRQFLRRLVDEVLSATNRRCPIELLLGNLPVETRADERLLRHIFTNLLTNAVKYSEPGCAVQFEFNCNGTDMVSSIRDQGIGIPEADQEWLFDPFHRARNVGNRPGTGLGLVIVKRCVDLHGGDIRIESKPGEGTTVTLRLPKLPTATTANGPPIRNGEQK
jgi:PAS domain S-box-containing protein